MTAPPCIPGFHVRPLLESDVPALQVLFDEDPEYFEINGRAIPVEEIRTALPPGRTADDKFLFVLERDGRHAGMIDIIRDYPEPHVWHLGFIFLSKRARWWNRTPLSARTLRLGAGTRRDSDPAWRRRTQREGAASLRYGRL